MSGLRCQIPTLWSRCKKKLSPNTLVNASAAADEMVECQVYSGNAGVCKYGRQSGLKYLFITVSGLQVLYVYFESQHCIKASNMAMVLLQMHKQLLHNLHVLLCSYTYNAHPMAEVKTFCS